MPKEMTLEALARLVQEDLRENSKQHAAIVAVLDNVSARLHQVARSLSNISRWHHGLERDVSEIDDRLYRVERKIGLTRTR